MPRVRGLLTGGLWLRSAVSLQRLAAILLIGWLAFGLRVVQLGAQSLWYDEGLSVYLAGLPPQATIQISAITDHPPLHALMLGVWMQAAGRSEFAVRFLSLWWSVLAVALTWRLGRELLTDVIGALGALLTAASALAVWYAQETRGYSLLLALTLISTWAFAAILIPGPAQRPHEKEKSRSPHPIRKRGPGRGWAWAALILASIAALYTHYYAAFTLLALNLAFFAILACRSQDTSGKKQNVPLASRFYLSQLAVVIAFVPWLPAAIRQATTNVTYFPGRIGWQTVVTDTLRAFGTGDVATTTLAGWAVGAMGALAIAGAFAEQAGTTRLNRVMAVLLVAVPVAAMAFIAWQKPKFATRYLIEALPAFYLLAGAGITALWRFSVGQDGILPTLRRALVLIVTGILMITGVSSLRAAYFDPARQRPDLRGVAAYIAANEKPGDVIVLLSGHQKPVFDYYYRGKNTIVPMPEGILPPAQSPLDYNAAQKLKDIARDHGRVWLVQWQRELADPTDIISNELLAKSSRLGVGRDFHAIGLMLFDLSNHKPFGDGPQQATDIRFAEPISLAGYDVSAADRKPGESIELALYWRASGRISRNYQVFTHLLAPDSSSLGGGRMVSGSDHIAGADNYPASLWADGALIRNTFTLRVPPDAPPGRYLIEIGLYDAAGRLKLDNGADRLLLTQVVVK